MYGKDAQGSRPAPKVKMGERMRAGLRRGGGRRRSSHLPGFRRKGSD